MALSIHHYPAAALLSDGLRAIFGVAMTLGPLLFLDVASPLAVIFGVLGIVFLVFALRVLIQGISSFELLDNGVSRRGLLARYLAWSDVTSLKLAHYATPRRSSDGWYQLTLTGDGGALRIDSTIDGFDDIVMAAVRAADAKGLTVDPATGENLKGFTKGLGRESAFG